MSTRLPSILLLALIGCASNLGPIDEPDFERILRSSMSVADDELLLTGRGIWYPGSNGTEFIANPELQERREVGLLVLFDQEIALVQWDEESERYDVKRRVAYADLSDVRLAEFGVAAVIALEAAGETFDTVTFTSGGGGLYNRARTLNALSLLEERVSMKVLDYRE